MDWSLLKRVSRSFYLTLRLLPAPVREPVSLAYMLARLSDTLADGVETPAESELVRRRSEVEAWLKKSPDKAAIMEVWHTIQEGQRFDERRFSKDAPPLTPQELDRYTYLVAGCVGEFWTKICAQKLPHFSERPDEEMAALGVRFGKGLQLVNILRDRQADAVRGRRYFTDGQMGELLREAREHLGAGAIYARSVKSRRLRAACALPLLLAEDTLRLVEQNPGAARVKVSRSRVRWLLLRSLFY